MTPENTYVNPGSGRVTCRECTKERQRRRQIRKLNGVTLPKRGFHNADAKRAEEKKWDEMFAKNPPVIEWIPNGKGVYVPNVVRDPHVDRTTRPRRPKGLRPIDVEFLGEVS